MVFLPFIFKIILKKGTSVSWNFLQASVACRNKELVKYLISIGINPNIKDSLGFNCLKINKFCIDFESKSIEIYEPDLEFEDLLMNYEAFRIKKIFRETFKSNHENLNFVFE